MKQDVECLLRCPTTGLPLERCDSGWLVTTDGSHRYPTVDGKPFLIDIQQSVIDCYPKDVSTSSPIERRNRSGIAQFVKRLLSPEKQSTRKNIDRLVQLLAGKSNPTVLVIGGGTAGQGTQALYDAPEIGRAHV